VVRSHLKSYLERHKSAHASASFSERQRVSLETSPQAPALAAHNGNLYIAWKGDGNDQQGSYSTFATRKSPVVLVGLKFI
jgi:hypothetical protein